CCRRLCRTRGPVGVARSGEGRTTPFWGGFSQYPGKFLRPPPPKKTEVTPPRLQAESGFLSGPRMTGDRVLADNPTSAAQGTAEAKPRPAHSGLRSKPPRSHSKVPSVVAWPCYTDVCLPSVRANAQPLIPPPLRNL